MKIVIAGCGIVGTALAGRLAGEKHNVTIIDIDEKNLAFVQNSFDILGISGDVTDPAVLNEAAVSSCDLFIAVTDSDKENILSCMLAKKLGAANTIARIRENGSVEAARVLKDEMNLSMLINPEQDAAREIFNSLKYKPVGQVESLAKGTTDIITFEVEKEAPVCGLALRDIGKTLGCRILVCGLKRDGVVQIPSADTVIQGGDVLSFAATTDNAVRFLKKMKFDTNPVKSLAIIGGSKLGVILAQRVLETGIKVKVIDGDEKRCKELLKLIPDAEIICGDGTDADLLEEEEIFSCSAVVVATEDDATNTMIAMYIGRQAPECKVIMKIKKSDFEDMLYGMNIAGICNPKHITVENIARYVKAVQNSFENEVASACRVIDNKVHILEFLVGKDSPHTGKSLSDLKLRRDLLVTTIYRKGKSFIPGGEDTFEPGDNVIVATTYDDISRFADIFE